jgi:two-component system sensor histidine kinase DegS
LHALLVFMETQFKIKCKLEYQLPDDAVDILAATNLYRIIQETMNNAVKHNQARNFNICLACDQDRIILTVRDDGRPPSDSSEHSEGIGRDIMEYRAKLLRASMVHQTTKTGGNEMILSFSQHMVLTA